MEEKNRRFYLPNRFEGEIPSSFSLKATKH